MPHRPQGELPKELPGEVESTAVNMKDAALMPRQSTASFALAVTELDPFRVEGLLTRLMTRRWSTAGADATERPKPAFQKLVDREQWDQWTQAIGLACGLLLVAVPITAIWVVDRAFGLHGCEEQPEFGVICTCTFATPKAFGLAYRSALFQGVLAALLLLLW